MLPPWRRVTRPLRCLLWRRRVEIAPRLTQRQCQPPALRREPKQWIIAGVSFFAQSTASHDDAITSSQNTTEEAADHSRGKSLARSTASSVDFQGHHLAGSEVVARSSAHLWSFCANLPHFLGNLSHFCFLSSSVAANSFCGRKARLLSSAPELNS